MAGNNLPRPARPGCSGGSLKTECRTAEPQDLRNASREKNGAKSTSGSMAACSFGFYNGCCRKGVFSGVTPDGFRAGAAVWLLSHPCRNRRAPGDWDYILAVCRCCCCLGWYAGMLPGGFKTPSQQPCGAAGTVAVPSGAVAGSDAAPVRAAAWSWHTGLEQGTDKKIPRRSGEPCQTLMVSRDCLLNILEVDFLDLL